MKYRIDLVHEELLRFYAQKYIYTFSYIVCVTLRFLLVTGLLGPRKIPESIRRQVQNFKGALEVLLVSVTL